MYLRYVDRAPPDENERKPSYMAGMVEEIYRIGEAAAVLRGVAGGARGRRAARVVLVWLSVLASEFFTIESSPKPPPLESPPAGRRRMTNDVGRGVRLVLHVGPVKTATSSIQCSLAELERTGALADLLSAKLIESESCRPWRKLKKERLDAYRERFGLESISDAHEAVVVGGSFLPNCIDGKAWNATLAAAGGGTKNPPPECWSSSFGAFIDNYYSEGALNTYVISNEILTTRFGKLEGEGLCEGVLNALLDSLPPDSRVDIVYTQRYLFETLVSFHKQQYGTFTRPRTHVFPPRGQALPLLHEWAKSNFDFFHRTFSDAIRCFRRASEENDRIRLSVLDYNSDTRDVLGDFFSQLANDGDGGMVDELRNRTARTSEKNTASGRGEEMSYDRIVMSAYSDGLVGQRGGVERRDARGALKRHVQDSGEEIRFDVACPTASFYSSILEMSTQMHELVYGYDGERMGRMSEAFWKAVEEGKFCDVDGRATIESNGLRQVLIDILEKNG